MFQCRERDERPDHETSTAQQLILTPRLNLVELVDVLFQMYLSCQSECLIFLLLVLCVWLYMCRAGGSMTMRI